MDKRIWEQMSNLEQFDYVDRLEEEINAFHEACYHMGRAMDDLSRATNDVIVASSTARTARDKEVNMLRHYDYLLRKYGSIESSDCVRSGIKYEDTRKESENANNS